MPIGVGRVTTRRPLEINLNHQSDADKAPWAEFPEELAGQTFIDFNEVRDTIIMLTYTVCGPGNKIINKPIILNIYSHASPDLTLVDLPSINYIPLPG